MQPVKDVSAAVKNQRARNNTCGICGITHGACRDCSMQGCPATFHPLCAWYEGLFMLVDSVNMECNFYLFCPAHTPEHALGKFGMKPMYPMPSPPRIASTTGFTQPHAFAYRQQIPQTQTHPSLMAPMPPSSSSSSSSSSSVQPLTHHPYNPSLPPQTQTHVHPHAHAHLHPHAYPHPQPQPQPQPSATPAVNHPQPLITPTPEEVSSIEYDPLLPAHLQKDFPASPAPNTPGFPSPEQMRLFHVYTQRQQQHQAANYELARSELAKKSSNSVASAVRSGSGWHQYVEGLVDPRIVLRMKEQQRYIPLSLSLSLLLSLILSISPSKVISYISYIYIYIYILCIYVYVVLA